LSLLPASASKPSQILAVTMITKMPAEVLKQITMAVGPIDPSKHLPEEILFGGSPIKTITF
jgi:hypothetical protein